MSLVRQPQANFGKDGARWVKRGTGSGVKRKSDRGRGRWWREGGEGEGGSQREENVWNSNCVIAPEQTLVLPARRPVECASVCECASVERRLTQ